MKRFKFTNIPFLLCLAALLGACSQEDIEGEGSAFFNLSIRTDITTRAAVAEEDIPALQQKCVLYISNAKGLIHKYRGTENFPASLPLKAGNYVAEAWTGDSVPASFDKKFYRCYVPFEIAAGETHNVDLKCNIANVVTRVDDSGISNDEMPSYTLTVSHTKGSLEYTRENSSLPGYFMLPNGVTGLKWTLSGYNAHGVTFKREGEILNVKPAHLYTFRFEFNQDPSDKGGALVNIRVIEEEIETHEQEVEFHGAPVFKGEGFDMDSPVSAAPGKFTEPLTINVFTYKNVQSFIMTFPDGVKNALGLKTNTVNCHGLSDELRKEFADAGITWDNNYNEETLHSKSQLHFSAEALNKLPVGSYDITFHAVGGAGKEREKTLRLIISDNKAVVIEPGSDEISDGQMDILATSAKIRVNIIQEGLLNPSVQYRKKGTSEWLSTGITAAARTRAANVKIFNIAGLQPGTTYQARAVGDGFEQSDYVEFTTESPFVIPNASMEQWSNFVDNSKVRIPSADGKRTFWDSGNHGSATMSKTLTNGVTTIFNSGTMSAELHSMFVGIGTMGKFAAGNLFAGEYKKTDGTDGVLSFGRTYNNSHPVKLRLYVHYRPGTVDSKGAVSGYLSQGDTDQAQIYVAITNGPVEIRTKESDRKLFNKDDDQVLGYGERSFTENFAPDGQMAVVEIPIEYFDRARTTKATHLVIVCSASKFGDFFCGGEGSLLYVDDFELIYE